MQVVTVEMLSLAPAGGRAAAFLSLVLGLSLVRARTLEVTRRLIYVG